MKKLGFGLMRLPLLDEADVSSIDIKQAKKMVDLFIERGFTYFDTAWMYHNFKSEEAVKKILTSRYPRSAYQIATKLHAEYFDSAKEREEVFTSQLKKIGVDYFDYYLLHDMNRNYYEKYKRLGCIEWLTEKKREGFIKNIGFSFHDTVDVLDMILTENPDFDFVQLQINYLDWESESVQSRQCYETARRHNKSIIIMEPVKGGLLSQLPEAAEGLMHEAHPDWCVAEWAIKFAASLDGVITVLSGMSNLSQMEENTKIHTDLLTESDIDILTNCAKIINSSIKIPCTGCNYCTDGCPKNIPIPKIFSLYNAVCSHEASIHHNPAREAEALQSYSDCNKNKIFERARDCIECGGCEIICPQGLDIRKYLKKVLR